MFAVRVPPHFLNQAPPMAQQLSRPDLPKVPHFGHVVTIMFADMVAGIEADRVIAWAVIDGVVNTATILRT